MPIRLKQLEWDELSWPDRLWHLGNYYTDYTIADRSEMLKSDIEKLRFGILDKPKTPRQRQLMRAMWEDMFCED